MNTISQQHAGDVKDRIFRSAAHLFIRNGFKGTSVRDIASHSGTNAAMVNYYFGSKYELFETVFEKAFNILWERVFATLSSDKDFFSMIKEWVDAYYEVLLEYPQIPIFLLNEVSLGPDRLTERFREHQPYKVFLLVSSRIKEEVAKGTIRDTPPLDFLLNVVSMSIFPFIFRNLARPVAAVTEEQYDIMLREHKDYVSDFIIRALRP